MDFFLDHIEPKESIRHLLENLFLPITEEEVVEAIKSLSNGRSPGPDGISIEFYKAVFSIIKTELIELFNFYMNNGRISAKIKSGLIVLIPKQPPYDEIENYRPITLLNCDYKIYTKILSNRLQPILKEIIHESQYAQPGKDINEMNCLVRDLIDDMKVSTNDSFMVSVDFKKAYDTICHDFLFKILQKYGFPVQFIDVIKELFRDAGAHLLINKYKSRKFKLRSGTQQGNPLSRDIFTLQLNPLLVFLNNCQLISKYKSLSNKSFLTLAYMDDANFLSQSLSSVINSIFYIKKFEGASGLAMNLFKTKGMFFNKRNVFEVRHLPNIKWENVFTCLKINYGSEHWVLEQWKGRLEKFKEEVKFFTSTAFTMRAKAILSKNKLLPMLSYLGAVHEIPLNVRKQIEKILLRFVVPFLPTKYTTDEEVTQKIQTLAAPKFLGGCEIDHISVHLDLFLLKTVMKYLKCLVDGVDLPDHLYFVEYNIGFQLCNYFGFPVNNSTPHAATPNSFYNNVLRMIRWLRITVKEMTEGGVNCIYRRIIYNLNVCNKGFKSHRILSKVLPSYLQSFNYKLHFNLLPLKTMFKEWRLDNDSCCLYCGVGPESIYHLFGTCEKLKGLWVILRETHLLLTGEDFNYEYQRKSFRLDLTLTPCNEVYEKTLIYLSTIANYSIWRHRNDIRYKFESFNLHTLVKKMIRSIGARRNVDYNVSDSHKIPFITQLYDFILIAFNNYPFDNG